VATQKRSGGASKDDLAPPLRFPHFSRKGFCLRSVEEGTIIPSERYSFTSRPSAGPHSVSINAARIHDRRIKALMDGRRTDGRIPRYDWRVGLT
jgi:hypothetical protein